MKIKIINKGQNPLPKYAHKGDACVDLRADFTSGFNDELGEGCAWDDERKCVILFSGGRCLIGTGLYTEFDKGYLQIQPRSGLALKSGVSVYNAPATIDKNFRGEIGVILINLSSEPFEIRQGDRIAQMAHISLQPMIFEEVKELEDSERGDGGFGSSGIK